MAVEAASDKELPHIENIDGNIFCGKLFLECQLLMTVERRPVPQRFAVPGRRSNSLHCLRTQLHLRRVWTRRPRHRIPLQAQAQSALGHRRRRGPCGPPAKDHQRNRKSLLWLQPSDGNAGGRGMPGVRQSPARVLHHATTVRRRGTDRLLRVRQVRP